MRGPVQPDQIAIQNRFDNGSNAAVNVVTSLNRNLEYLIHELQVRKKTLGLKL